MLTCKTVAVHLCLCCIDQPTTSDNIYAKMRMSYLLIKIGLVRLCLLSGQMLNCCVLSLIRPVFQLSSLVCFRTLCSVIEQQANRCINCDVMCMTCVI